MAASVSDPSQGNMTSKILASLHQGLFLPKATLIGWCVVDFWKDYVAIKKCGSIKPKTTSWRRYDCQYGLIRVHPHRFDTENNWFLKWIRYLNSPHLCPPILTVSPRSWYLYSLYSLAFWPFNPQRHKMVNSFKQFVGISRRIVSSCPFWGVGS